MADEQLLEDQNLSDNGSDTQTPEPIYKTKDGQTVTHSQLLSSGYDKSRIDKGIGNGVLKIIGDTQHPDQQFKTKDGQTVTTSQLLSSGYEQDRIDKGVHNGILMPVEVKKKDVSQDTSTNSSSGVSPSPSSSSEGNNPSNITVNPNASSNTPSVDNNFGLPSDRELARNNQSQSDNTASTGVQQSLNYVDTELHKDERAKVKKENREKAITNTAISSLKLKGIKPTEVQLNQEKQKYQEQLDNGNASVALDKDGVPGLKRVTGGMENLVNGWNEATKGNEENANFVNNMTTQEMVDYMNKNPDKIKPSEYIGERRSGAGSLGHFLGGAGPYLGKAAVGAAIGTAAVMAAPETGGASLLAGAPTAAAFLMTAPDMANQGAKDEITRRFQILKKEHPEKSDVDVMEEAKHGAIAGGVGGILTNAALMGTGLNNPVSMEAKSMLGNTVKHIVKSSAEMGGISAGVTAAQQAEGNLEGVKTSASDIFKNSVESFKDNATTGLLLTSLIHGVPNVFKSVVKNILVKEGDPIKIQEDLQHNENAGNVPQGTTEKIMNDLGAYKEALSKTANGLSPEAEASVAGLIQKRTNIEEEAKTKDVSAQPIYKEKTDAINQQISEIQRTNKPLEHEIDEATGKTYIKPTYDDEAKNKVEDLANKISKGNRIDDPVDLQTQANFPNELEKQLQAISKEEKSKQKDKENPNTELSDNIDKYISSQSKTATNGNEKTNDAQAERGQEVNNEGVGSETAPIVKPVENVNGENEKTTNTEIPVSTEKESQPVKGVSEIEQPPKEGEQKNTNKEVAKYDDKDIEDFVTNSKFKTNSDNTHQYFNINEDKQIRITKNNKTGAGKGYRVTVHEKGEDGGYKKEYISNDFETSLGDAKKAAAKIYFDETRKDVPTNVDISDKKIDYSKMPTDELKALGEKTNDFSEMAAIKKELDVRKSEPKTSNSEEVKDENGIVSTKKVVNEKLASDFGLPKIPIPKLGSDVEEIGKAKERIDSGKSNPLNIVSELLNDTPLEDKKISVNDRYDMQYYMLQLKQHSAELARKINNNEKKLIDEPNNQKAKDDFVYLTQQSADHSDNYINAIRANEIGSSIWGKSGNAMQVEMSEHGEVLQRVQRIRDWYGNDVPPVIDKKLKEIQSNLDKANSKISDLTEKYDKLNLENAALKIQAEEKTTKTKRTSSDYKTERKNIVEDIQKALKKARGEINVTPIPYAKELIAITPHVLKLFKSYAAEGLNKIEDIVNKIHEDLKEHIPLITKNDVKDILRGEYKKPKTPIERNSEFIKATKVKSNSMFMLRHLEKTAMNSQKNLYMKGLDFSLKWERTAIFAFNTSVFMKLNSAALYGSFLHKPLEMLAGKGISKIFPKIAKAAPIEGDENLQSLGKFYGEFINPIKFAKQAWEIYSKGESHLTQENSTKNVGSQYVYRNPLTEKGVVKKSTAALGYLRPILEVYTNTHAVIKDPVKRATFESAMINQLRWYKKNGIEDVNHPLIMESARQYAYKRAEYEIFQENNKLSGKIGQFFNQLEKTGILENKVGGVYNKISGNAKYTAAALYHFFVPISTVAINLTRRLGLGAQLPFNFAKAHNLEKGIKELEPEQADLILRQLKKGAVGAAYWTLGLCLYQNSGGIWNRFDPDKKKGSRLKSDQLKIGELDVPKGVQHASQLQSFQYGATARNVYHHYKDEMGANTYEALGAATLATLSGLLEGVPPAKEASKLIEGISDPNKAKQVLKDAKRSVGIDKLKDLGLLSKEESNSKEIKEPKEPREPKEPK